MRVPGKGRSSTHFSRFAAVDVSVVHVAVRVLPGFRFHPLFRLVLLDGADDACVTTLRVVDVTRIQGVVEFSHLATAELTRGVLAHQVVVDFVGEGLWVVESTLNVVRVHVVLASYVPKFSIHVRLGAVNAYGCVRE